MLKSLIETGLGTKTGITIVSSPFVVKVLSMFQWVDANMLQIGIWLSAILTLTLILGHWINQYREGRKDKIALDAAIRDKEIDELEKEELKLKVELLKLELKEKKEDLGDGNSISK